MFPVAVSVKFLTKPLGLYLHLPFCGSKCKYCDFYSTYATDELLDSYTVGLINALKEWGGKINRPIDTIYLGGGTPSLLSHRLPTLLQAVNDSFSVLNDAEITLEMNPTGEVSQILEFAKSAGINRLSIGAQSGIDRELELLGRTHTAADTENTVRLARKAGFDNISLDIMLALPFSNRESLDYSLRFIDRLEPDHISAYLLKIEEKTVFYKQRDKLCLPDDDTQAEQYLQMCDFFKKRGFEHYEISNFCRNQKLSRHNTKYWLGDDYLGIGPSAHSCLDGKRFYYSRDLKAFLRGESPIEDGKSGSSEEFVMLRLRLERGFSPYEYRSEFGKELSYGFLERCKLFKKTGLLNEGERISLTDKGMLVSNTIITELLECLE